MIKKAVAMTLVMFLSTAALASGPGWTEFSKVTQIVVTSAGGINVRLDPELSNCVSASGYGGLYASIYPSHVGLDRIHSTLLAAYVSGNRVQLYLSDDTCKVVEIRTELLK